MDVKAASVVGNTQKNTGIVTYNIKALYNYIDQCNMDQEEVYNDKL
jgi:hypothetical protein